MLPAPRGVLQGKNGFSERLAWDGPGIDTGASHDPSFLYHRHPCTEFGGLNSGSLAGRSAPDAEKVKLFWHHYVDGSDWGEEMAN